MKIKQNSFGFFCQFHITKQLSFMNRNELFHCFYFHNNQIFYQLTIDNQPIYLIEGMKFILDDFIGYKIELTGMLDIDSQSRHPYPVISAKSVSLLL